MREHEVPTHVQAEDRVLLWLTFPQIVAVVAVCAVAYGAYRYFPVGPSEFRLGVAVLLGALGIAMTVGKVGGRGLPLVAADLLKFNLGSRRYAGPVSELLRSEFPTPEPAEARANPVLQVVKRIGQLVPGLARAATSRIRSAPSAEPGPAETSAPELAQSRPNTLLLLIRKTLTGLGVAARAARRRGRPPFRAHLWFGKRRRVVDAGKGKNPRRREGRGRKPRRLSMALALITLTALTIPAFALADGPWSDDAWRLEEIGYLPPDPVPGRRLYVEEISVTGTLAMITVRAATEIRLDVRSYGGNSGRVLTFFVHDLLEQGATERIGLSLDGPRPSFTFAWQDGLGQTGALSLKGRQLPHPMPSADGDVCSLRLDSLGWTPGTLSGVIVSQCAGELEERVELPVSAGHHSQSVDTLLPATVTGVTGTVTVNAGGAGTSATFVPDGAGTSATFVPDGDTSFTLPVAAGETVHGIEMDAALSASLSVPQPPLVQLTHHPHRVESRTETVSLLRPGVSQYVSRTTPVALPPDNKVVNYTIGATLSVPSATVQQDVTLQIDHPEHVKAEVVTRDALIRTRSETVVMTTTLAADAAYQALALPDPTPTPEPVIHRPLTDEETRELFGKSGRREFP